MKLINYLKNKLNKRSLVCASLSASMLLLSSIESNAQNQPEIIKSETHLGGYHIKCNGQGSGVLKANPNFGSAPYTFLWNTGDTAATISDLAPGTYFVTVTDFNNNVQTDTFKLKQPRPFTFESKLSDFNGYNISTNGASDGSIEIFANGGTPPYQYQWNNADSVSIRKNLTAGSYGFTIIDANQCITSSSITLTAPAPMQVSFSNIQGTQCFNGNDGKATININGGLGDFSVVWKNGSFSMSPDDLYAGYNAVRIYQQGRAVLDTGVTIPEPSAIESQFVLSQYNGFNVSCADCFNGSINTTVTGGTAPYTYQWSDANNSTSNNLNNLNGGEYNLLITDANGCTLKNSVYLSMPTPKDWSRSGNSNIDAAEFIGSTDNSPLTFKVNNEEVLKMESDTVNFYTKIRFTDINTDTVFSNNSKLLGIDENGNIKAFERGEILPGPSFPPGCSSCGCSPVIGWGVPSDMINGVNVPIVTNDIVKCPLDGNVGIGTTHPEANTKLDLQGEIAIFGERLSVLYNGNVGVGTSAPNEKLHLFGGNFKVSCPWDNQNPVFFADHAQKNVGVGTASPRGKFEVKVNESDNLTFGAMHTMASGYATSYIGFNFFRDGNANWKTTSDGSNSGGSVIFSNVLGDLMFSNVNGESIPDEITTNDAGIKFNTKMTLSSDGRLGIGVNPRNDLDLLNYKLVVNGNIKCKKLRVDLQNWGDFVFDSNYELMDLNSIEQFISKNKHLPGMPDAAQIEKEGIEVGEMVRLQQIKIEELTLLLIKMQKQIDLSTHKN